MFHWRLGLMPLVLAAIQPVCGSHPVITVYEYSPFYGDPVLISNSHGDEFSGVAGRTYRFDVTLSWSGQPQKGLDYFWRTDTGRHGEGWQPLPADGRVEVATLPAESWLEFSASGNLAGSATVTVLLDSPDMPGS